MESELNEGLNSYTKNINIELLITTAVFMVAGFIYYIYILRRLIQPVNIENENNNNHVNNNANDNINIQNNINNKSEENNNINENERIYHITIQIERGRYKPGMLL